MSKVLGYIMKKDDKWLKVSVCVGDDKWVKGVVNKEKLLDVIAADREAVTIVDYGDDDGQ